MGQHRKSFFIGEIWPTMEAQNLGSDLVGIRFVFRANSQTDAVATMENITVLLAIKGHVNIKVRPLDLDGMPTRYFDEEASRKALNNG